MVLPWLVAVLVGCSAPSVSGDASLPALDVAAALRTAEGVQVVRAGAVDEAASGVVGLDGDTVVTTSTDGSRTEVAWEDLATGSVTGSFAVDGDLTAVATDRTGVLVALAPAAGSTPEGQIAPGRSSTEIVVVSRIDGEIGRWRLDGNLVPEGFGSADQPDGVPPLFVVEYLPPERPEVYRVRWLDASTGTLHLPVDLRTKGEVDQDMAGISRTSTYSAAHDLLFTLYRGVHGDRHTGEYAFVHTLGFNRGVWCLAVPDEMGVASEPGAVGLTADESRVVVASATGMVGSYRVATVLDPELGPEMDRLVDLGVTSESTPAIAAHGDVLWVALGDDLLALDADSLVERRHIESPVTIVAMTARADGTLLVAGDDRLLHLDPVGGEVLGDLPLPGTVTAVTTI